MHAQRRDAVSGAGLVVQIQDPLLGGCQIDATAGAGFGSVPSLNDKNGVLG
jgi:hypothetical protein